MYSYSMVRAFLGGCDFDDSGTAHRFSCAATDLEGRLVEIIVLKFGLGFKIQIETRVFTTAAHRPRRRPFTILWVCDAWHSRCGFCSRAWSFGARTGPVLAPAPPGLLELEIGNLKLARVLSHP